MLELMMDGSQAQIIFQSLERSLDFGELNVEPPEADGIASAEIGA